MQKLPAWVPITSLFLTCLIRVHFVHQLHQLISVLGRAWSWRGRPVALTFGALVVVILQLLELALLALLVHLAVRIWYLKNFLQRTGRWQLCYVNWFVALAMRLPLWFALWRWVQLKRLDRLKAQVNEFQVFKKLVFVVSLVIIFAAVGWPGTT